MKMGIRTLIILTMLIQIGSCSIYKSNVPITNSDSSTIDTSWIDKWVILDESELFFYPFAEINLQPFNKREYVATLKYFENKGKRINSVETFKGHNSKLENDEFLNIQRLDIKNKNYLFYKIEQDLKDSIYIKYLTDSLKIEFETSNELQDYLTKEQNNVEEVNWSPSITLFRWKTLTWDRIHKQDNREKFEAFYLLGKLDEDYFSNLSVAEITKIFENKDEIPIEIIREYFNEIRLCNYGKVFWKVPNYGLLKLKTGNYIKLKFDMYGSYLLDMTNDRYYLNSNKVKWRF